MKSSGKKKKRSKRELDKSSNERKKK